MHSRLKGYVYSTGQMPAIAILLAGCLADILVSVGHTNGIKRKEHMSVRFMLKKMSEDIIVKHCSPTLAGMKTGNMFSCLFANEYEMTDSMRHWNRMLGKKGLRVLPLRFQDNRALVYVYRVSRLSRDLKDGAACRMLRERGYETDVPELCITRLIRKLKNCGEFPHEIGLFLGYPPEDVCGFIENGAKGCKLTGCWKVYGNEDKARRTFAKYKKCTDVYTAQFAGGRSVDRLTVAG